MTFNINTAKALLAVIKTSDASRELDRVQVSTGACLVPSLTPSRRYVATNGYVLLVVEHEAEHCDEGTGTYNLADLKEYVSSKGYSPLTDRSDDYGSFPDWQQCTPTELGNPVETIGLSATYLKMLADIGRFLKVGDTWKVSFDGPLSATTWEPQDLGDYTRVSFIIMPIRLD